MRLLLSQLNDLTHGTYGLRRYVPEFLLACQSVRITVGLLAYFELRCLSSVQPVATLLSDDDEMMLNVLRCQLTY